MKRFLVLCSLFFSLLLVLSSWLSMAHAQQDTDVDPLTVTIKGPEDPQNEPFDITITFSEPVMAFLQESVLLSGADAIITDWIASTDGTIYTATITPSSTGSVDISIPAGVASGNAGNLNDASSTYTITVDIDPPIVEIVLPEGEQTGNFTIALVVSEPISSIRYWAVSVQGGTAWARFSNWTASYDNKTHTATATPIGTGELHISLRGRAALDLAGNYSVASENPSTIDVVDITPPRPAVYMGGAGEGEFLVDVYFNEKVVGFTQADISFTFEEVSEGEDEEPSATISEWLLIGDDDGSYGARMIVTEVGNSVILGVRIPADAVTDTSGNGNIAFDTEDQSSDEYANPGSPESPNVLEAQLERLLAESDGSAKYLNAIRQLETLLAEPRPDETVLLANYPNPFNPETWIPYQLANASDVVITIYDARGTIIRRLELGHQREGYYTTRSRAAYWDGHNDLGERVASGIYFYQLQTDHTSLLRKMLILK